MTTVDVARWAEAVAKYQPSLVLGMNTADVHYQLASALHALGRSPDARAELEEGRRLQTQEH